MQRKQTPSQTVGPYFAIGLVPQQHGFDYPGVVNVKLDESAPGKHIVISGEVVDGERAPVNDAMLEFWQADARGAYPRAAGTRAGTNQYFSGFARLDTDADPQHRYRLETVKPGVCGAGQAPHISVIVFMRGLLMHLHTRLYFSDEADANGTDPVLCAVPDQRRQTLIATCDAESNHYRFDIHMQGDRETVFFDV